MTVEELYLWARMNGIENYEIIISPTISNYSPEFSEIEIDEKELEIIF